MTPNEINVAMAEVDGADITPCPLCGTIHALKEKLKSEYSRGVSAGKQEALKYTPEERDRYGKLVAEYEEFIKLREQLRQRDEQKEHCKDCCCAQSWEALNIKEYDGKSIPEHITDLREQLTAEREAHKLTKQRFSAPIVCLCGSTRFKQTWIAENARLTGEGNIVLAVGLWGHHERKMPDAETKAQLDALHLRKIDLCDWVFVLDVGGYIGESTRKEIAYAQAKGLPVHYLSQQFPHYIEPKDDLLQRAEAAEKACEARADDLRHIAGTNASAEYLRTLAREALDIKDPGSSYVPKSQLDEAIKALNGCVAVIELLHETVLNGKGYSEQGLYQCQEALSAAEKVTKP